MVLMALSRWIWTKQLYYIIWPLANVSNTTQSTPKQIKMCKITIFILLFKKIAIPETSENDDKVRTIIRLILETGVDINAKTFPAGESCVHLAGTVSSLLSIPKCVVTYSMVLYSTLW